MLNRFPCRVGTPHQKWCETRREAIERINRHNGVTDVYVSLYNDGVVDKVAWDFDIEPDGDDKYSSWEEALEDFRKMTLHFEDKGWQQMSVLSGGGLHKYLKTNPVELEYPRYALKEVQEKFQQELDLKTDDAIFGDIKRIMRVPNTYHPGAQRYCIPLKSDEVFLEKEELFELAETQREETQVMTEGDPYPIAQHDRMGSQYTSMNGEGTKVPGNFNPAEVEPEGTLFPIYPCISNLLQNWDDMEQKGHGLGFRRRFLIILHLKETGHTYEEAVGILKKYLSHEEFRHAVYDEKQVEQIYKRDDLLFPKCESLMKEIPCIHQPEDNDPCDSKDDLYI